MWRVDGSKGEGGGQLLRIACGLAAALGEEVTVEGIRAGRPKPGLAAQHLAALEALAALTQGELEGGRVGSTRIAFRPGSARAAKLRVDVGTAGSVTLVLQALLPACFAAPGPVSLRLTGGTDVAWAPPWDFFAQVHLSHLASLGLRVEAELLRRGHYPEGGGEVAVTVHPGRPALPEWLAGTGSAGAARPAAAPGPPERGQAIEGVLHLTGLEAHIAARMERAARKELLGHDVSVRLDETQGTPGTGLVLWTREGPRLGAAALGAPGVRAEEVGVSCVRALSAELEAGCTLDVHSADQILPLLALAGEPSSFTVRERTGHLETLAALLSDLGVARVRVEGAGPVRVTVGPERRV